MCCDRPEKGIAKTVFSPPATAGESCGPWCWDTPERRWLTPGVPSSDGDQLSWMAWNRGAGALGGGSRQLSPTRSRHCERWSGLDLSVALGFCSLASDSPEPSSGSNLEQFPFGTECRYFVLMPVSTNR